MTTAAVWTLTVVAGVIWPAADAANGGTPPSFRLTVLHANDVHSRYDETGRDAGKCVTIDSGASCTGYGGMGRLRNALDRERARARSDATVFLFAGDAFQGTPFYDLMRWEPAADFLGELGVDAMCLGNHEFEDGPAGLAPFLNSGNMSSIPVVVTNLDITDEPTLSKIQQSTVLNVAGHTLGVVGYLTPDTVWSNKAGKVKINDEIESLKPVVAELKRRGVEFVIALGHSGLEMDRRVAREVDGVDAVVGGHSHTYLFSGPRQDSEIPVGPYPLLEKRGNLTVPVVQAYAFTKYLGKMVLTFDGLGKLVDVAGEPILLDRNIPQDIKTVEKVKRYKRLMAEKKSDNPVGTTKVLLDGDGCRCAECNLGNAIADAFVRSNVNRLMNDNASCTGWTDAAVAIMLAGGIQRSITQGTVFKSNVLTALPYKSPLNKVTLTGRTIVEALEHSASLLDKPKCAVPEKNIYGGFMQVAGLQVTYDMKQTEGSRVRSVAVRCADCRTPLYEPLLPERKYKVILSKYVANGGDLYNMIRDDKIDSEDLGITEVDALHDYIKQFSPIISQIEGRSLVLK
ncbi:protein 5NUC-like [Adelges cooleyi]|uniref:protein 5NUC-like n=1 Tax=Adelges cooleyi TaxID=133065 RepID=UPI00217F6A2D|nr:protein 5NUC-like [Adelges cooleyi]